LLHAVPIILIIFWNHDFIINLSAQHSVGQKDALQADTCAFVFVIFWLRDNREGEPYMLAILVI
jgi:hypothetical protein